MIGILKFLGALVALLIACGVLIAKAPAVAQVVLGGLLLAAVFAGYLPNERLTSARTDTPKRFRLAQALTALLLLFLWGGSMVESAEERELQAFKEASAERLEQCTKAEALAATDPVAAFLIVDSLEFTESEADVASRAIAIAESTLEAFRKHLAAKVIKAFDAHDMEAGRKGEAELRGHDAEAPELAAIDKSRSAAEAAIAAQQLSERIKQVNLAHEQTEAHLDKEEFAEAHALLDQASDLIPKLGNADASAASGLIQEKLTDTLKTRELRQQLEKITGAQKAAKEHLKNKELLDAEKRLQEAQAILDALASGADTQGAQKKQEKLAKALQRPLAKLRLAAIREEHESWIESADIAEKGADDMVSMKEYVEADTLFADAIRYFREIPEEHRRLLKLEARLAKVESRRAANTSRVQEQQAQALAAQRQRQALEEKCGAKPIWAGKRDRFSPAEYYLEDKVHDPSGLEVFNCGPAHLDPNYCWLLTCQVRAKNAFGARRLQRMRFAYMKFTVFSAENVR